MTVDSERNFCHHHKKCSKCRRRCQAAISNVIQNIVNFLAVITVLIIVANAATMVVNAPKKVFTDRKNNSKNRSIVAEKKDLYILQTNLKS